MEIGAGFPLKRKIVFSPPVADFERWSGFIATKQDFTETVSKPTADYGARR
jgi:hypothetical protein